MGDAATGKRLAESSHGHEERVTALELSPNGKHLASGSRNGTVRVWDTETLEALSEPVI